MALSSLLYLLYLLFQKKQVESLYKHLIPWLDLCFGEPVTLDSELHWCFLGEHGSWRRLELGIFLPSGMSGLITFQIKLWQNSFSWGQGLFRTATSGGRTQKPTRTFSQVHQSQILAHPCMPHCACSPIHPMNSASCWSVVTARWYEDHRLLIW